MNLHRVRGHAHGRIGGVEFCLGRLAAVPLMLVRQIGRVPDEKAGRLHRRSHVGEHEVQPLVGPDGAPELDPRFGVGEGGLEGGAGQPQAYRGDIHPAFVQGFHGPLEPFPLVPQAVFPRHDHILQDDFGHVQGPLSHLILHLPDGEARGLAGNHKTADALRSLGRIDGGKNTVQGGIAGVGDETFLSVQHVMVALELGPGFQPPRVGPGFSLGQPEGGRLSGFVQGDEEAALLLVRPAAQNGPAGQRVDADHSVEGHAGGVHLLADEGGIQQP